MRKIINACLCLLLIVAMTVTVFATGSAQFSVSPTNKTAYRGDTVTFTVSLSSSTQATQYGLMLFYDPSVFELVDGTCDVPGALVTSFDNGFAVQFQNPTAYSGSVGTVTLKVKDNAAFGSYEVSGTASVKNGNDTVVAFGCSIIITITCQHNYQNCTKVSDSDHKSTCSICGDEMTEAHTWNEGTVTEAATCQDTGSKTYTCTGCGAEKVEILPVADDHSFGSWSKVSDFAHSATCTVCGKTETRDHSWNTGRVTKAATCQETGSRVRTCINCSATKTETISKTGHSYGQWSIIDDSGHIHSCTVCGKEESAAHSYNDAWEHDSEEHFQSCDECGHVKDPQPHVPGPEATETTDQLCTVCGRVLQSMANHTHIFDEDWIGDETGHWHPCSECNEQGSFGSHAYDNNCDPDCNICGMERTAPHDPVESLSSDETGHWYACQSCGEKADFEVHAPGTDATVTAAQLCTVCGYEIAPVLPHEHSYGTTHLHQCACGEIYEADAENCQICCVKDQSFPWLIICILGALLLGGAAAYYFLWYKKPKKEEEYLP